MIRKKLMNHEKKETSNAQEIIKELLKSKRFTIRENNLTKLFYLP